MKKIIFLFGIVVVIIIFVALSQAGKFSNVFQFEKTRSTVTINDYTYRVLIADNEATRVKGLSGRKKLNSDQGMLFIFQKKGKYQFWMKDMLFPLDMIFINDNTITDITKNAEPLDPQNPSYTLYGPSQDVNYVLEVNAGEADKHNMKVGDKVEMKQ